VLIRVSASPTRAKRKGPKLSSFLRRRRIGVLRVIRSLSKKPVNPVDPVEERILKKRTLIFLSITLLSILGIVYSWIHLATWLVAADQPQKADVIVCLGGVERVKKSAEFFHQGLAPLVILTVSRSKKPLADLKVPENRIILAPGPTTTYEEALAVSPILNRLHCRSALVVSDPFHLRRVRWTFTYVLANQPVKLVFASSDFPWKEEGWWRNEQEKFYVYSEITKIGYYRLAHGLLGIGEEPGWVVDLKKRYQVWLKKVTGA
jgi:uncharacterized SAM-binding protein YcdF (DUF218 family)